jgi:putative ABC transport system permease protein
MKTNYCLPILLFCRFFSFKLLAGNPKTALSEPNKILITPAMAKKYFGNQNPIGKTLAYQTKSHMDFSNGKAVQIPGEKHLFNITGIIQSPPSNSTLEYNFVASFNSLATIDKNGYSFNKPGLGSYLHYFLLKNEASAKKLETTLNQVIVAPIEGMKVKFSAAPLSTLHFGDSNQQLVYIFLGIALIILLLALINYMSLTTSRSATRAKEVGVRKVVGAGRGQLARQFFGESLFFTFFSFLISLVLMQLMLPTFYALVQVKIPLSFLWQPHFLLVVFAVLLTSGLISGIYPALLLSRFIPVEVMKGKFTSGQGGVNLRKMFIVFQFSVSVALIICSLVIQKQLDFIHTKDIGLNKEQILVIPLSSAIGKKYLSFKNDLKTQTGVLHVAASTGVPFKPEGTNIMFSETPDKKPINLVINNIDEDFLKTYGIKWQEKLPEADSFDKIDGKVILNEVAVREMDLKNPLGKKIPFGGTPKEVVGVVQDFNFMSLQSKVTALALSPVKDTSGALMMANGYLSVRLDPKANVQQKLTDFAQIYKAYETENPFEYFFLDETFDKLYKYEDRLANVFKTFTFFAIFIACLGLFGLATFTAERRTKEIGIRKVFGASAASIVGLLSREFVWLVLISNAIAFPFAWYFMHQWIQNYPYRIELSWWIFALAGIMALLIALLTVSFQAIRAAGTNPVKSLRTE